MAEDTPQTAAPGFGANAAVAAPVIAPSGSDSLPAGHDVVFPIPFPVFAATLKSTSDEVFTHILRVRYGRENHLLTEWHEILVALHDEKV